MQAMRIFKGTMYACLLFPCLPKRFQCRGLSDKMEAKTSALEK